MKKIFKWALSAACVMGMVACNGGNTEITSDKEEALQRVVPPYVNNTVIATYSAMADEGLKLLASTQQIADAVEAGTDYTTVMIEADTHWRAMRKHWEQSEAFLFGPVDAHAIDPHIDSWPLDFNAMNALLSNVAQMQNIEEAGIAYVRGALGPTLQGFHACEYLLFESEIRDGRAVGTGRPHAANLTKAESVYLLGVVSDLVEQACVLEYCWKGEISDAKMKVLEDAEIEPWNDRYGEQLINAGKAGSVYVSYQAVAEEIVAGCIDIADEVAKLKLGNPYLSSNDEERDYIESPYSCTSTIDFADNIRSIQHAYCGSQAGDQSISNYVSRQDAELDAIVRKAIDEAIAAIEAIQNFESTAQNNPQVKAAIDKVAALGDVLDKEVMALLAK